MGKDDDPVPNSHKAVEASDHDYSQDGKNDAEYDRDREKQCSEGDGNKAKNRVDEHFEILLFNQDHSTMEIVSEQVRPAITVIFPDVCREWETRDARRHAG